MVMMQQCYSGGFSVPLLNLSCARRVHFAASCQADKPSMGGAQFNPFSLEWITGISGFTEDGRNIRDKFEYLEKQMFSANKAFAYALQHKNPKDTPVVGEFPRGAGNHIYLGLSKS